MSAHSEAQALEKTRLQVARKVRELRTRLNWTQIELARKLGLSQGRLSALERGTGSFTAEQLLKAPVAVGDTAGPVDAGTGG